MGDGAGIQPKIATDFAPAMDLGADVEMPNPRFEDLAVISFQPQVYKSSSLEERPSIDTVYTSNFFLPSGLPIPSYPPVDTSKII